MAADPSFNVHPDLLPHIHLISAYRYPLVPRFGIPEVTEWLLNAPRIARDGAPFFWSYLDVPQDGTILLTWQPLQRLGTEFASDGYVWPRGEVYYQHEIRDGLILEVLHQPAGYRPGEEYATHARRRFRLMPPKVPNPNTPQVDPSLWLVHYGPIEEREPMPVKKLRVEPRLRNIMEARNSLMRAGQIARKEFMLSDRVNWPHISLPRDLRGPPMYGGGMPGGGHHVPQQMAYPPHMGGNLAPPPPSKRARHSVGPSAMQPGHAPPPPNGAHPMMQQMDVAIYEDDEDTSRGDMFDHITPRDVSLERYKQNHEWMEEVISSPYRISQIGYADLGLGLQGELAPVTEGIFEGQGADAFQRVPKKPYVGCLDAGLADAFRKRVTETVAAAEAEMAEMKASHEKTVANLRVHSVIKTAEHDLRLAPGTEAEPEGWRLEDRVGNDDEDGSESGGGRWAHQKPRKTVAEIAAHVETALGRRIVGSGGVVRVQDGGFQEPEPEPEPEPELEPEPVAPEQLLGVPAVPSAATTGGNGATTGASPAGSQISGMMIGDGDMDIGDTAAGLLDQMESAFSPASTPSNNFSVTPHGQPLPTTGLSNVVTPGSLGGPLVATLAGATGRTAGELSMADTVLAPAPAAGNDDWVVVPPGGGVSPEGVAGATASAAHALSAPVAPAAPVSPIAADVTPGGDFGSLEDLDTAGEALGLGEDLDLDMEDSAFGDAFQGAD